jgi:uncharacterized iron-regulated membrane protein
VVVLCAFTLTWLSGTGVVLWWRQRNARGTRETARATHDSIGIVSNVYLLALGISAICFILPIAPLVYWITGSKEPRRPPLSSVAVEGGSTISPDQVARVATGALPGLLPETVLFPASRTAAYRVGMRQGESTLLAGDVQIDQYSGKLLAAARINNSEPAMRIVQGIRSFHVGRWLGIPSQILAALAGLAIAAQALTGFLMWRNARRRVAARYREPAPEPAAQSLR